MGTKIKYISIGLVLSLIISLGAVFAKKVMLEAEKPALKYYFNGEEKTPADGEEGFIYNDRTYVPIRFVSESLDKDVFWNEETESIEINDKKRKPIYYYERGSIICRDFYGSKWGVLTFEKLPRFSDIESDISSEGGSVITQQLLNVHKNYLIIWIHYFNNNEQTTRDNVYRYNLYDDTYTLIESYESVWGTHYPKVLCEKLIIDSAYGLMRIYNIETMEKIFEETDENMSTHTVRDDNIYYFKSMDTDINEEGVPLYIKKVGEEEERILCRFPFSGYVEISYGYICVMDFEDYSLVYTAKLDGTDMKKGYSSDADFIFYDIDEGYQRRN